MEEKQQQQKGEYFHTPQATKKMLIIQALK
jgi:hypothetical protein